METIDSRVAILELRADNTDDKTKALAETQTTFGTSLKAIETVLVQIKWALYGAGFIVAVNFTGLAGTITKLVLHS